MTTHLASTDGGWLGHVPARWDVLPISRLSRVVSTGGTPSPDSFSIDGLPWFTPGDFGNNGRPSSSPVRYITKESAISEGLSIYPPDAVMIVSIGNIGGTYAAKTEATSNQQINAVVPNDRIRSDFLAYALVAARPILQMQAMSSLLPILNQSRLKAIRLPVPPLDEQIATTDFLDRETIEADALVTKYERLIALLDEKRVALITQAVIKGLDPSVPMKDSGVASIGQIPENWPMLALRRVISDFVDYRGSTPTKSYSGIRIVTAANVKSGYIDYDVVEVFMPEDEYRTRMVRGFPAVGDVLLTMEAPLGQCAQVDNPDIALGQRVMLLKSDTSLLDSSYLKWYFLSRAGQDELFSQATGSTALGIKASKLKGIPIPVPPLVEQEQIAAHIERELAQLERLRSAVGYAIKLVQERRSALITAAVTGQIDISNYRSKNLPFEGAA